MKKLNYLLSILALTLFSFTAVSNAQVVGAVNWVAGTTTPPAEFAPPAPYALKAVGSTDSSVFLAPNYMHDLNLNGMYNSANVSNALAWIQFQN